MSGGGGGGGGMTASTTSECRNVHLPLITDITTHPLASLWLLLPVMVGGSGVNRGRFPKKNCCAKVTLLFSLPASTLTIRGSPFSLTACTNH